jgi:hypothetical protein
MPQALSTPGYVTYWQYSVHVTASKLTIDTMFVLCLVLQEDLLASALEGPDALLDCLIKGKRATTEPQVSSSSLSNLEQLRATSEVSLNQAIVRSFQWGKGRVHCTMHD